MAVKNTAKVIIGGKIITLGGYESEEYFQKVASYINKKMDELSAMPGYSRQPMETKHTLISLNITDDYFKAKKQAEVFEQDLQQKDQEMYDLKHELISAQIKLENAEKQGKDGSEVIDLLMISKYLERIGDHATNIAEWVEFSITGVHKGGEKI